MTERSKQERDQRALDALIVSKLRQDEKCDNVKAEHLPRLTPEEEAILDSFGSDFIDQITSESVEPCEDTEPPDEREELACAGGMAFGMNRADDLAPEAQAEIEKKRKEAIERIKKQKENDGQTDR